MGNHWPEVLQMVIYSLVQYSYCPLGMRPLFHKVGIWVSLHIWAGSGMGHWSVRTWSYYSRGMGLLIHGSQYLYLEAGELIPSDRTIEGLSVGGWVPLEQTDW